MFRMNPTVVSGALQVYSDAAETVLRIALHDLPPPGQPADPAWVTIKNPVPTLKINGELMLKITTNLPELHQPKYMVVLYPNIRNLIYSLNQVNDLTPLCKLKTNFAVQKQLKGVVDLIKRTFIFPSAISKLKELIKNPQFSIVFRSPIPDLYRPAEKLHNKFFQLQKEAGEQLFKEMEKFDRVVKYKLSKIDKEASWAPIPEHYFQFRAPTITLPLVLIDAFFPEVYRFGVDPLPFCTMNTVTEATPFASYPVSGCQVETCETAEEQPVVIINGVPKTLGTIDPDSLAHLSQSSAPLFFNSSQSSLSASPPPKKLKTPGTQTQIANLFAQSQDPQGTVDCVDDLDCFSDQEIKIEPYEG